LPDEPSAAAEVRGQYERVAVMEREDHMAVLRRHEVRMLRGERTVTRSTLGWHSTTM
jgi:hypothetical protein